jgi:ribonuclease HII
LAAGFAVRADTVHLYGFDIAVSNQTGLVLAGVDEAGRGPLAGPVVAGAAVLDYSRPVAGVNDSKKLSAKKRDTLYGEITSSAIAWATGIATVEEIDSLNILNATFLAMRRALEGLKTEWGLALIDGNMTVRAYPAEKQRCVTGGDAKSACIAAASILAKVTRDRILEEYETVYPGYGFSAHKGYGTEAHRAAIQKKGICPVHRKSFCGNFIS